MMHEFQDSNENRKDDYAGIVVSVFPKQEVDEEMNSWICRRLENWRRN